MRLVDINYESIDELDPVIALKRLCDVTGSCSENGYLGGELDTLDYDDNHILEFSSKCERNGSVFESRGASLMDSILIKQTITGEDTTSYYLYSWDVHTNDYTVLTVENEDYLNRYYEQMKKMNINLCDGELSTKFQKMGLTLSGVNRVLLNQSFDPMKSLMEEYEFSKEAKEDFKK